MFNVLKGWYFCIKSAAPTLDIVLERIVEVMAGLAQGHTVAAYSTPLWQVGLGGDYLNAFAYDLLG